MEEKVVGGEGDVGVVSTQQKEWKVSPKRSVFVDKLYSNDRIVKFSSEGHMTFGEVRVNSQTKKSWVSWGDGKDEDLEAVGDGVALKQMIGILDRKSIGLGSKVTNGKKIGQVREKRFLVSAVLNDNWTAVIKDVPSDAFESLGPSKKNDKVVYNDNFIGVIVSTRARVEFEMDKDGKRGWYVADDFSEFLPKVGDKIPKLDASKLWDVTWMDRSNWWWNFYKYSYGPATITESNVDCYSIAWMGQIDRCSETVALGRTGFPKNVIKGDDVPAVRQLYGRSWKYMREFLSYGYQWKNGDILVSFDHWIKDITDTLFFGMRDENCIDMNLNDGLQMPKIEVGTFVKVKVAAWRSVVDIEWDDGSFESLPIHEVCPFQFDEQDEARMYGDFCASDFVADLTEGNSAKYGIVMKVSKDYAEVKWITPITGRLAKVSMESHVRYSDIELHSEYIYLKSLYHLPIMVPRLQTEEGDKIPVDGVRVGVVVGINAAEAKIILKCPDGTEKLVWAHDFEHFEADVFLNHENKWMPWYAMDQKTNTIVNQCYTIKPGVKTVIPDFVNLVEFPAVDNEESESDSDSNSEIDEIDPIVLPQMQFLI